MVCAFLYMERTISVSSVAQSDRVIVYRDLNPLIAHWNNGALKVFLQSIIHEPWTIMLIWSMTKIIINRSTKSTYFLINNWTLYLSWMTNISSTKCPSIQFEFVTVLKSSYASLKLLSQTFGWKIMMSLII